jgi:diadenosine tetraphosphatase ApaH/serine/threonine PP2A family protein phosphatase
MRQTALKALEWTQDNISPNNARYLRSLPSGRAVDEMFIMVHGSLVERDAYILNATEVARNLECMANDFAELKVCFFAHTHVPMLIGTKAVVTDLQRTRTFQLDKDDIYLINPGSVGQPRDKCPMASFGIFDAEKWTMTFIRKEYDVKLAQRRIIEAGLPEKFARRLAIGV